MSLVKKHLDTILALPLMSEQKAKQFLNNCPLEVFKVLREIAYNLVSNNIELDKSDLKKNKKFWLLMQQLAKNRLTKKLLIKNSKLLQLMIQVSRSTLLQL